MGKAMGAMKAMKKKSVSKIGKGSHAKSMVLRGSKEKTVGGLTAKDLTKNKYGKVVEQEGKCSLQEEPMDPGHCEGAQGLEDHGLCCDQEGLARVRQGEGVLHPVSAAFTRGEDGGAYGGTSSGCGDFRSR